MPASLQSSDAGSRAHGLFVLQHLGSLAKARGLSCPAASGTFVPQARIKPASPALEGGSSTTGLPGKSGFTLLLFLLLDEHVLC